MTFTQRTPGGSPWDISSIKGIVKGNTKMYDFFIFAFLFSVVGNLNMTHDVVNWVIFTFLFMYAMLYLFN